MDNSKRLTPDTVAVILGVSQPTLYRYINKGALSGFTVNAVANYIQVKQLNVDKMTKLFAQLRGD